MGDYTVNEMIILGNEEEIMSKWRDIRCDFFNEEEEKYIVNA